MLIKMQRFPSVGPVFDPIMHFGQGLDDIFDRFLMPVAGRPRVAYPAIDVAERKDDTLVVAELPGVSKDGISITVQNGVLTIAGERKKLDLPEAACCIRSEIGRGQFRRSIELPHPVNAHEVTAELSNGILRIVLPRAEEARVREITVK